MEPNLELIISNTDSGRTLSDMVMEPVGRRYKVELPSFIPVLELLDQRWNISILRLIGSGVTRFNELSRQSAANPNTLRARLKEFEDAGLIMRRIDPQNNQKVDYMLTGMGLELAHILDALAEWTDKHYGLIPQPTHAVVAEPTAVLYRAE